jgi:hypothetical protein
VAKALVAKIELPANATAKTQALEVRVDIRYLQALQYASDVEGLSRIQEKAGATLRSQYIGYAARVIPHRRRPRGVSGRDVALIASFHRENAGTARRKR